ncbi:protein-export chaperone SecB [Pelagibacterales bacterium SAG-MED23]|nr:protein-export chaperone SecB [Pelagibacterales bacterium SAG-MED23]
MENKYKIIVSYIQDLSIEIPSPETLITIRNTIPEYKMKVDIKSKPLKRKMIEVLTTLTYENPNKKQEKGIFQIKYATAIDILDVQIKKKELEKIVLSDLQTKIYPELEDKFLNILRNSGLPDLKFGSKIDFEKLYNERLN